VRANTSNRCNMSNCASFPCAVNGELEVVLLSVGAERSEASSLPLRSAFGAAHQMIFACAHVSGKVIPTCCASAVFQHRVAFQRGRDVPLVIGSQQRNKTISGQRDSSETPPYAEHKCCKHNGDEGKEEYAYSAGDLRRTTPSINLHHRGKLCAPEPSQRR